MSEISFEVLELSIQAVEEGLREHNEYPKLMTVRDGVIQRFEVAMDISRKLLVRVLRENYNVDEGRARKDTFREAASVGLIADSERWLEHLEARNATSHTYDSTMAEQVFARIPEFLPDARDMLNRLKNAS